jgi:hypothetical protein
MYGSMGEMSNIYIIMKGRGHSGVTRVDSLISKWTLETLDVTVETSLNWLTIRLKWLAFVNAAKNCHVLQR